MLARRNPDGTLKGSIPREQTEKELERRKAAMESYFARSKAAEERMLKQAKGVREPNVIAPPSDVLGFVELQLLSDPATLDGKGSAGLRTLTDDQRRARARARMDEQAADARKALDKAIGEDEDDDPHDFTGLIGEEAEAVIERDDDDDDFSFLDDVSLTDVEDD